MRRFLPILLGCISVAAARADGAPPNGDAVIHAKAGPSDIVITTTNRLGGAIHSLTWNGKEFINSTDHGRQLQCAVAFDWDRGFNAESYNPTEAGSRDDGAGDKSSSKLLRLHAEGAELQTTIQMAFWLTPGEKSGNDPARNGKALSDCVVAKRVHIGHNGLAHAIEFDTTFTVPRGETHTSVHFEAPTGYMPAEFDRFWKYNADKADLERLNNRNGEQDRPVVLSTADGAYAMGVYSPDQPSPGFERVGYGRFHFKAEKVNKWNCVFRVRDPKGIAGGDYHFRTFVAVGTLEDVKTTLTALSKEFRHP